MIKLLEQLCISNYDSDRKEAALSSHEFSLVDIWEDLDDKVRLTLWSGSMPSGSFRLNKTTKIKVLNLQERIVVRRDLPEESGLQYSAGGREMQFHLVFKLSLR